MALSDRQETVEALEATGPFTTVDAALTLLRRGGLSAVMRALLGSTPVAFLVLAFFFFESVEGVHELRGGFAVLFVVAWGIRAVVLGRVAHGYVLTVWPDLQTSGGAGSIAKTLRTHAYSALTLCVWLVPFAMVSWLGLVGVALMAPLLSFRAFSAPSLLASAAHNPEAGFSGFVRAIRDGADRRTLAVVGELWLILGAALVALNLYFGLVLIVLLGRSLLGLDATYVEMFVSFKNTFVLLSAATLGALLMEPVRAAVHAIHFLDVRVRRPGLDLELAVEAFVERRGRTLAGGGARRLGSAGFLAVAAVGLFGGIPPVVAQPMDGPETTQSRWTHGDERTAEHVANILERDVFSNDESSTSSDLSAWIADFFAWLLEQRRREAPEAGMSPAGFSPPPGVFVGLALAILLPILLWVLWITLFKRKNKTPSNPEAEDGVAAALEKPPEVHLDDAARLALAGRHREALRSLYLATLVAFDAEGVLVFDGSRTNGQTIRLLPSGRVRDDFRRFTRLFDATWYGHAPAGEQEYQASRALAEGIANHLRGGHPA